jgi:hypothetical protein
MLTAIRLRGHRTYQPPKIEYTWQITRYDKCVNNMQKLLATCTAKMQTYSLWYVSNFARWLKFVFQIGMLNKQTSAMAANQVKGPLGKFLLSPLPNRSSFLSVFVTFPIFFYFRPERAPWPAWALGHCPVCPPYLAATEPPGPPAKTCISALSVVCPGQAWNLLTVIHFTIGVSYPGGH